MAARTTFLNFECKTCKRAKEIYWTNDGGQCTLTKPKTKHILDPEFIYCTYYRHVKHKFDSGCHRLASKKEVEYARTQTLSN